MAYYEMQESNLPNEEGKRILFPRMKLSGQTSLDELAQNISHAGTFTPGDVKGLVQSLIEEIASAMASGRSVKIDGLGIFTPALGLRKGADRETTGDDVAQRNAASLCVNAIRFKADKGFVTRTDAACRLERAPEKFRQSSDRHTTEERLKMAQDYLETHPFMTIDDYCALTGLLRYTASRELRQWKDDPSKGITTTGRGTHKVYVKR